MYNLEAWSRDWVFLLIEENASRTANVKCVKVIIAGYLDFGNRGPVYTISDSYCPIATFVSDRGAVCNTPVMFARRSTDQSEDRLASLRR